MSTNMVFAGQNLPAPAALAQSLRNMEREVMPGGVVILKMDKTGHWVYGADQTEVEGDTRWVVNPFSFVHGYIAWGDGEVLGEKMESIMEPLPELPPAPAGAKKGWEPQIGMALECLTGPDAGMKCRFTTTSVGGKRSVQELGALIAEQVDKDPVNVYPVVSLGKEHYQHKSYGRIFTPVFNIVEWIAAKGMDDAEILEADDAAYELEEAPAPVVDVQVEEPVRQRRRTRY